MPNNKKQRGRDNQKKKEAQNEAQKKAAVLIAEKKTASLQAEREKQLAWLEKDLQRKFGTPGIDELLKELALSSSTVSTAEENELVCYHGSVAKHFVAGSEYSQLLKTYVKLQKKNLDDYENQFGKINEFLNHAKNQNHVLDPNFAQFVFAIGVSLYYKLTPREKKLYSKSAETTNMENSIIFELWSITQFANDIRYNLIPKANNQEVDITKLNKYDRDIDTERGLINCLHRETKRYCTCMASNKIEAKNMDKLEQCACCAKLFPKDKLKACKKCDLVFYCSLTCCENMWPMHKKDCQPYVRGAAVAASLQNDPQHAAKLIGEMTPEQLRYQATMLKSNSAQMTDAQIQAAMAQLEMMTVAMEKMAMPQMQNMTTEQMQAKQQLTAAMETMEMSQMQNMTTGQIQAAQQQGIDDGCGLDGIGRIGMGGMDPQRKTAGFRSSANNSGSESRHSIIVALDWTPNTNHIGLYVAQALGFFAARNLDVSFLLPEDLPSGQTPARCVRDGTATVAVAPSESAISFATADRGVPCLRAVAALLQGSTSAICTLQSSGIDRPSKLDGKRYASYNGRFEDPQVAAMVRHDGGRGDVVFHGLDSFGYGDTETMGAGSVVTSFLERDKSDATWVFEHWEGVLAERAGQRLHYFRLEEYGIPYGYSPVLLAHPDSLVAGSVAASAMRAFLAAAAEGYAFATREPKNAANLMMRVAAHRSLQDAAFVEASAIALAPKILRPGVGDGAGQQQWGVMTLERWQAFVDFLLEHGIIRDREGKVVTDVDVPALFTNEFLTEDT